LDNRFGTAAVLVQHNIHIRFDWHHQE
jgi:hypothetical protein